jgi:hypothetical protein
MQQLLHGWARRRGIAGARKSPGRWTLGTRSTILSTMRAGPWPAGRPAGLLTVFFDGCRRLARAPGVLAVVWAVSVVGFPGFYYLLQAYGIALLAVGGEVIGVDDGWTRVTAMVVSGLLLVVWTFLWGGIIDRYARPGGASATSVLAAGRAYFGRMLRIGLIGGLAFTLTQFAEPAIFNWIANLWPFNRQRAGWAATVAMWLPIYVSMVPSWAVRVLTDLTRVRLVADDRRSVLSAAAAGWRLLAARPLAVIGIYLLGAVVFMAWSSLWSSLFPEEGPYGEGWLPPLAGWLYWAVRVVPEMLIPAALVALYQAEMTRGALVGAEPIVAAPAFVPEISASLAKE